MAWLSAGLQVCTITHISLAFYFFLFLFLYFKLLLYMSLLCCFFSLNSSPSTLILFIFLFTLTLGLSDKGSPLLFLPSLNTPHPTLHHQGWQEGWSQQEKGFRGEVGGGWKVEEGGKGREDETFQCKIKTLIYWEPAAFYMIFAEYTGTCLKAGSYSLTHSLTDTDNLSFPESLFSIIH